MVEKFTWVPNFVTWVGCDNFGKEVLDLTLSWSHTAGLYLFQNKLVLNYVLLMKERSDRFGAKTKFRLNRSVVGVDGFQV